MKCFWCKQDTPDKEDKFEMCVSCYTKTLDGFTLMEYTDKPTNCKVNDKYLTGVFVVIDRNVIKDIVVHNKSDVSYVMVLPSGKKVKKTMRTTVVQRHAMKQIFTLDVIKAQRAIISTAIFEKFYQSQNKPKIIHY